MIINDSSAAKSRRPGKPTEAALASNPARIAGTIAPLAQSGE
ncbi:hypothetical protein [Sphingomonas sp. VNH70]|jgi:hypothetical protein